MSDWQSIETAPENVLVLTRIKDNQHGERNVQTLVRRGKLWWASDNTYVYYQPTHWKPVR